MYIYIYLCDLYIYIDMYTHTNSADIYHKMFLDQLQPQNSDVIRRAWKTRASGQVNKVSQTEKNMVSLEGVQHD